MMPSKAHTGGERDVKGRFLKGNSVARGRPWSSPGIRLTYHTALEKACTPEDLFAITRRAVADARAGDAAARAYIVKILGLEQLRVTIGRDLSPASNVVYRLDALSDADLETLDALATKMLAPPDR